MEPIHEIGKSIAQPTLELFSSGMVEFSSQLPYRKIVFGANPSTEHPDAATTVQIGKDVLPVKLVDAGIDTSRQHFGISKDGGGPFIVENYSKGPLNISDFIGAKRILAPGSSLPVAKDSMEMQRLSITWGRGHEVSVQSIGANTDKSRWSVGFRWSPSKV